MADLLIDAMHNRSTVFAIWRQYASLSNTWFLGPTSLAFQKGNSIGSAVFAQTMPHSPYTLYCATLFFPNFGFEYSSNIRFLKPTRPTNANDIPVSRFSTIHARYQRTDRHGSRPVSLTWYSVFPTTLPSMSARYREVLYNFISPFLVEKLIKQSNN